MFGGVINPCVGCEAKDDLGMERLSAFHHPVDSYVGLALALLIGWGVGLYYSYAGDQETFRATAGVGFWGGIMYYRSRSTRITYDLLFCEPCRKRYLTRKYIRIVIITTIILVSIVGAVITSAVMGNDDYIHIPFVIAGIIGVVALCFKLLSRPRVVSIGDKVSTVNIPGIGRRQVTTLPD